MPYHAHPSVILSAARGSCATEGKSKDPDDADLLPCRFREFYRFPRADPTHESPAGFRTASPLHKYKETPGEAPGVEVGYLPAAVHLLSRNVRRASLY